MKQLIRKTILDKRKALKKSEVDFLSEKIGENLKTWFDPIVSKESQLKVGIYYPILNEVDCVVVVDILEKHFSKRMNFSFPIITNFEKSEMKFVKVETSDVINRKFIKVNVGFEPENYDLKTQQENNIDLFLVPIVGFTEGNYRIGMGKGFYDRLFEGNKSLKIGLAYDFQKAYFDSNEIKECFDKNDVPLDLIVTENKFYSKLS